MKLVARLFRNLVAWCLLVVFGGSGCATERDGQKPAFIVRREHFQSAGVKILVDVYTPTDAARPVGRARLPSSRGEEVDKVAEVAPPARRSLALPKSAAPPVLVLHGAGGMLFDGPAMARVARDLAAAGYEVYQVHYFNRTHTWFARQAVLLELFPTWRETVQEAVAWVHSRRPDAPRVGLFGYSLGAFAAIETARRDPSIGAVAEQAGGFWHAEPEGPTRQPLPPMLLIHGLEDQRVPFAKYTRPLMAFLRAHNDPFETRFYPGEGHNFRAPAQARVRAQAVDFFRRQLPGSRK